MDGCREFISRPRISAPALRSSHALLLPVIKKVSDMHLSSQQAESKARYWRGKAVGSPHPGRNGKRFNTLAREIGPVEPVRKYPTQLQTWLGRDNKLMSIKMALAIRSRLVRGDFYTNGSSFLKSMWILIQPAHRYHEYTYVWRYGKTNVLWPSTQDRVHS